MQQEPQRNYVIKIVYVEEFMFLLILTVSEKEIYNTVIVQQ